MKLRVLFFILIHRLYVDTKRVFLAQKDSIDLKTLNLIASVIRLHSKVKCQRQYLFWILTGGLYFLYENHAISNSRNEALFSYLDP